MQRIRAALGFAYLNLAVTSAAVVSALEAADHRIRAGHLYRWLPVPSVLAAFAASWWWTMGNSLSAWGCDFLVSEGVDHGSRQCINVAGYWAEDVRVGLLSAAVTYLMLAAVFSGVEWFMDSRRQRGVRG